MDTRLMRTLRAMHASIVKNGPGNISEWFLLGGLYPLSCLYGIVVRLRRLLYQLGLKKAYRASIPLISIGNLTAGGTGKTPMVDYLVKQLQHRGVRCAIVSRGYGGRFCGNVGLVNGADGALLMSPEDCGDEPYLLARRNPQVPVYVARRRSDGVKQAEADGARIIILDDGFQHLAVARDLNILLLDAKAPFGNGRMLPAGILREPRANLRYSDLIILTRAKELQTLDVPHSAPVLRCWHELNETMSGVSGEQLNLKDVRDKRCLAFAGIAHPETFFASLRKAGMQNLTEIPLADHQDYTAKVLARLREACHNHDLMITTEKDAVKLSTTDFPIPYYQIGVDLVFAEDDVLDQRLDRLLASVSCVPPGCCAVSG